MRYLIGLVLAIVVIIFIIIRLLSGGGGETKQTLLEDYSMTDTTMRYVIDNPTQASQTHNQVEIVVGRSDATITVYQGYEGSVVRTKTYPMNTLAYRDFLRALRLTGHYTVGNDDPNFKDESGYCGLGNRFIYEIVDGSGTVIQHFWSTTCGEKTFRGEAAKVASLFKKQIPDYNKQVYGIKL